MGKGFYLTKNREYTLVDMNKCNTREGEEGIILFYYS